MVSKICGGKQNRIPQPLPLIYALTHRNDRYLDRDRVKSTTHHTPHTSLELDHVHFLVS
jgi:hypothetical protein